jgi:branched-chain amino acid:cation transporter, LIVCS family
MNKTTILSAGLALFAMLFGAGNIIFPLMLGRDAGIHVGYALAGFCLTAILVPLLGIVAVTTCGGEYKKMFGAIGAVPSAIIICLSMVLIGPFGCIPRCMAVSHAALAWYLPALNLQFFSVLAGLCVFLLTMRKSSLLTIVGKVLAPLKLTLLLGIIIVGLGVSHGSVLVTMPAKTAFFKGFTEGYGTMDLLGAIFFAGLVCSSIAKSEGGALSYARLARLGLYVGTISGLLLGLVYGGFCVIASYHAPALMGIEKQQLLSALANMMLGTYGGALANITIALSCLTTAIALTTVFAEFLSKEVFRGRLAYHYAVGTTVVVAGFMTSFGFKRIMELVVPVISLCYPVLIVIALLSLGQRLLGIKMNQIPVILSLILLLYLKWW